MQGQSIKKKSVHLFMMKFISTASCLHLFNRSTAVLDGHFSVLNMYFYEKYGNTKLDWLFNYKLIKKNSDKDKQERQCTPPQLC